MAVNQSNEWIFSCDKLPDNKELLATISNGFLGTRIFDDCIYAGGIFNGDHLNSHRAMIPSTIPVNITLKNIPEADLKNCYSLNTRLGCFVQTIRCKDNAIQVEQKIYAHRHYKNLIVTELKAKTSIETGCTLILESFAEITSKDIEFKSEQRKECNFMAGFTKETEYMGVPKMELAVAFTPPPRTELFVSKSEDWESHIFITAVSSSLEGKDPRVKVMNDFENAKCLIQKDYLTFWKSHENDWNDIWKSGTIKVDGNLQLAQAVNSSMYYIISSLIASWPYGLSPGGLPSNGYLGHTFWDQETWMYPPLLIFYQDMAKSCLEYRFERMSAAMKKANEAGYKGLMFPWESAVSGFEVCPEPYPYSKFEHHIVGDIGFAVQQYWMATHDSNWLQDKGFLLIKGVAEFWASRVEFDNVTKQYNINHIQGPDEYHYDVNNSVYTNVIAKINLEFAVEVCKMFKKEIPEAWPLITAKMYVPFDGEIQYHPEFDGYKMKTIVKQADVILIGYPLMYKMPENVRRNDLEIYEKYTDKNGPAMTKAMFAIGWLEMKNPSMASVSFKEGYANITEPFKIWTETPDGGEVNFITGAGGFLQSVIFGYGGIRLQIDGLYLDPILPDETTKLTFNGISYLGNKIKYEFDSENAIVEVTAKLRGSENLILLKEIKTFELKVGVPCKISNGKAVIKAMASS